jgi:hypothetical protein
MSANYSRRHLQWVRDGAAWVVRNGGTELVRVVPDEKYPGMWRVRSPDGRLSDMANITWAKDAAVTMALAVLNAVEQPYHEPGLADRQRRNLEQFDDARELVDAWRAGNVSWDYGAWGPDPDNPDCLISDDMSRGHGRDGRPQDPWSYRC